MTYITWNIVESYLETRCHATSWFAFVELMRRGTHAIFVFIIVHFSAKIIPNNRLAPPMELVPPGKSFTFFRAVRKLWKLLLNYIDFTVFTSKHAECIHYVIFWSFEKAKLFKPTSFLYTYLQLWHARGRCRIPRRRGRQPSKRGRQPTILSKISKKLHEIEKFLGRRGVLATPLRSATAWHEVRIDWADRRSATVQNSSGN